MQRTHSFFERKTLSSGFALCLVFAVLFLVPTKNVFALVPVGEVAPHNVVKSTITSIKTTVTAVATPISASTGLSQQTKEWGLDSVANLIAKKMLQRITVQTVNWINSGFKGNPAFITNPSGFFLDMADQTASEIFIGANSPLNQLCSPFRAQVRLALVKNYLTENNRQLSCTFRGIGKNFEKFTKDFNQGGWKAWYEITQEDQNNPYGAYMQGRDLINTSVSVQQGKYQKQLDWGKGFLSYERCRRDYVPTRTAPRCVKYKPLTIGGGTPGCLEYEKANADGEVIDCPASEKETVTPGSVINEHLGRTFGSTFAQLEAADELNEIINALMAQMLGKVFTGVDRGIRSLSKTNQTTSTRNSLMEQLMASSSQQALDEEIEAITDAIPTPPAPVGPTEAEIRQQVEQERQEFLNEAQQGSSLNQNTNTNP